MGGSAGGWVPGSERLFFARLGGLPLVLDITVSDLSILNPAQLAPMTRFVLGGSDDRIPP